MQACFEMQGRAQEMLAKSWLKRDKTEWNTGSVAITKNGAHASGLFESRTHLLDVTSEQAALALAVSRKDPHVSEVLTVVDGQFILNPIVIKVLGDHARRTGLPMGYHVFDRHGRQLFSCKDVAVHYDPPVDVIAHMTAWSPRENSVGVDSKKDISVQLRDAALQGMETHFSAGTNSRYGAAVRVKDKIYFGGVYSSYDHRLNLHAEMVAALAAIADSSREIEQVAIVSSKFVDDVPHMCGCCRQFFSEVEEKTGRKISVIAFSLDGKKTFEAKLSDYLPSGWSSGNALGRTE